jgi:hypothetical protein
MNGVVYIGHVLDKDSEEVEVVEPYRAAAARSMPDSLGASDLVR